MPTGRKTLTQTLDTFLIYATQLCMQSGTINAYQTSLAGTSLAGNSPTSLDGASLAGTFLAGTFPAGSQEQFGHLCYLKGLIRESIILPMYPNVMS